ncbi:glycosyltransferase family A protein [Flavobacterium okayamense]|uniref:Glycosyl transferase family 2 n=1 Tax=Flavobacterium okayamense TaxID=2830782 RepID=A0ABM7S066_9FLAO|nr:glycosyltransferase family A protein [Flavobacterium okayamense]BCY27246.1 hypothetical protein KK2020170_01140 [Flavobacterium okayamense]
MRIGLNPAKENKELTLDNYHRVIVPVYIPNFEGYFANLFEVFKLCIDSLIVTSHDKTRITIYNNNCHPDVKAYIDAKYHECELIDQVFHSKENLGKINAILAAAKGNLEPLITITDADVLFKHGWQKAVEQTFINFPEAGMVAPVPASKVYKKFTANNWFYSLIKGKLYFENVEDSVAMHRFDVSLGNDKPIYKDIHLNKYLVLTNKKNNAKAVMGCGHFVATLKRQVFDKGTNEPAFIKIVGGVENKFIDFPNEALGLLRIATKENFAYHMGNHTEEWMYDEFPKRDIEIKTNFSGNEFLIKPISSWGLFIGKQIVFLLDKSSKFRTYLFTRFGLSKSEAKEY